MYGTIPPKAAESKEAGTQRQIAHRDLDEAFDEAHYGHIKAARKMAAQAGQRAIDVAKKNSVDGASEN